MDDIDMSKRHFLEARDFEMKGETLTLYARGLLVREVIQLKRHYDVKTKGMAFFLECALCGIQDWDNVIVKRLSGEHTREINRYTLQMLPQRILVRMGRYIWTELTNLTDTDIDKLKGWARFMMAGQDDDSKDVQSSFNCEHCIENRMAKARNCGRFTQDERDRLYEEITGKAAPNSTDNGREKLNQAKQRYGTSKTFQTKKAAEDHKNKAQYVRDDGMIQLNKWEYPECPISYVNSDLKELVNIFYHCKEHNLLPFEGGVLDQPYRIWKAHQEVSNEFALMDKERHEERMDDHDS